MTDKTGKFSPFVENISEAAASEPASSQVQNLLNTE
jgi:hypothetical protein